MDLLWLVLVVVVVAGAVRWLTTQPHWPVPAPLAALLWVVTVVVLVLYVFRALGIAIPNLLR